MINNKAELDVIYDSLLSLKNPIKSQILSRFFKTGKGQYGEGDKFLGISVPDTRKLARRFSHCSFDILSSLIKSEYHEARLLALFIVIQKLKKSDEETKKKAYDFYFKNIKYINNWDLVDITCRFIVGDYLIEKDRSRLYTLAKSKNLWERRTAIVSTYSLIRIGQFDDTLKISEILLTDKHDLIHKAVGWMLREVGKKKEAVLVSFLKKNYKIMPRTTLRYSLERLPGEMREEFMKR